MTGAPMRPVEGSIVEEHASSAIQPVRPAQTGIEAAAHEWVRRDLDLSDAGMAERLHSILGEHLVHEAATGTWWQWMPDPAVNGVWHWVDQGPSWVSRTATMSVLHDVMREAELGAWRTAHPDSAAKTRLVTDRRKNRKNGVSPAMEHSRRLARFYSRLRNNYGVTAVVDELSSLAHVGSMSTGDPGLIPVANGVIDVRGDTPTFTAYGARPIDLVTRRMPVIWDPHAHHEGVKRMWSAWPEEESRALRRYFGQALTGKPAKRIVWLQGETNSGRSTLEAVMLSLVGDFGTTTPRTAFAQSRSSHDGPMHDLRGKRVILIADAEKVELSDRLKPFTSGGLDEMNTRPPYGRVSVTWVPAGIPFFVSNKLPAVDVFDDAIMERLVLMHLSSLSVPARDPSLVETMQTSGVARSALLNDLIDALMEAGDDDVRPPSHRALLWRLRAQDPICRWVLKGGGPNDYAGWRAETTASGLKPRVTEDEWREYVQVAGRWCGAAWATDPVELYDAYRASCRARRVSPEPMETFRAALASSRALRRDLGPEWLEAHWDEWEPWLDAEEAQVEFVRSFDRLNDGDTCITPPRIATIDPDVWDALVAVPVPPAASAAYLQWAEENDVVPVDVDDPMTPWSEASWCCRALNDWKSWHVMAKRTLEHWRAVHKREADEERERRAAEADRQEGERLALVLAGAQGGKGSPSLKDGPPRNYQLPSRAWTTNDQARARIMGKHSVDPFFPEVIAAVGRAAAAGETEVIIGSVTCSVHPRLESSGHLQRLPGDTDERESLR